MSAHGLFGFNALNGPAATHEVPSGGNAFLRSSLRQLSSCSVGLSKLSFAVFQIDAAPYVRNAIYVATRPRTNAGWPVEYIGQTERFVAVRMEEHARDAPWWWLHSTHVHVLVMENAAHRSVLETQLIDVLTPRGNALRGPAAHLL